ncbi:MAG: amidohydrolase family protein [Dokdonella sp.]
MKITPLAAALSMLFCMTASAQETEPAPAAASPATALLCGQVFDAASGKMLGASTILIDGKRIRSISAGHAGVGEATVIDLAELTCLPGLIDMHTHLTSETSPHGYEEGFRLNPADYALRGTAYAARTLLAGFTSVRDLGDSGNASIALRNAIDQGFVKGPRIFTAGKSIATTGGHADPTNGRNWDLTGDPGPKEGVINSVDDARKAVRQHYKEGVDVIKITSTGGVLSYAKNGQNPQFTVEEIKAITTTARDYGLRVAAHAHGDEGIQRAILGGVDSIEHGTYMSDATMKLMKQHGTWYVPTLSAGAYVADKARTAGYYPEIVRPKALAIGPQIKATFARAYQSGVKIAFGTDAAVFPHGDNGHELTLMVEAGMPASVALQAATVSAAELLDQSADLGSLSAGKYADVIAVRGNPLDNIAVMERVDFVMKDGVVHKPLTNLSVR